MNNISRFSAPTIKCFLARSSSFFVIPVGMSGTMAVFGLFVLFTALFLFPDLAHAGTGGTEFDAINNKITDMVEGSGGKLAATLGLVSAVAASVIRFNIWSVVGAFGVGATAGYGIPIVTSSITALI